MDAFYFISDQRSELRFPPSMGFCGLEELSLSLLIESPPGLVAISSVEVNANKSVWGL